MFNFACFEGSVVFVDLELKFFTLSLKNTEFNFGIYDDSIDMPMLGQRLVVSAAVIDGDIWEVKAINIIKE